MICKDTYNYLNNNDLNYRTHLKSFYSFTIHFPLLVSVVRNITPSCFNCLIFFSTPAILKPVISAISETVIFEFSDINSNIFPLLFPLLFLLEISSVFYILSFQHVKISKTQNYTIFCVLQFL